MVILSSIALIFLTLSCQADNTTISNNDIHQYLDIKPGYNRHQYPEQLHGPLPVNFSVNVRSVFSLSEKEEIISAEMSLRMYWRESRLRLLLPKDYPKNYITLHPSVAEKFWIPDVFIDRAKAVRVPTYHVKPTSLRIYNDSTMRFSSRINFDVACDLDFRSFPADKQVCEVKFESFGHDSDQIKIFWRKDLSTVNPNITLSQFQIFVEMENNYETDYYDLEYPGVYLRICLSRFISYHIVQTYVPSFMFVCTAWMSLYISPEVIPGRVAMGMTTLLTVTAMFSAVRQMQPSHDYVSYLDIWMVSIMFFVFSCLVEFIIVTYLIRSGKKDLGHKVDNMWHNVFPVFFFLYNLFYWPNIIMQYNKEPCKHSF